MQQRQQQTRIEWENEISFSETFFLHVHFVSLVPILLGWLRSAVFCVRRNGGDEDNKDKKQNNFIKFIFSILNRAAWRCQIWEVNTINCFVRKQLSSIFVNVCRRNRNSIMPTNKEKKKDRSLINTDISSLNLSPNWTHCPQSLYTAAAAQLHELWAKFDGTFCNDTRARVFL